MWQFYNSPSTIQALSHSSNVNTVSTNQNWQHFSTTSLNSISWNKIFVSWFKFRWNVVTWIKSVSIGFDNVSVMNMGQITPKLKTQVLHIYELLCLIELISWLMITAGWYRPNLSLMCIFIARAVPYNARQLYISGLDCEISLLT